MSPNFLRFTALQLECAIHSLSFRETNNLEIPGSMEKDDEHRFVTEMGESLNFFNVNPGSCPYRFLGIGVKGPKLDAWSFASSRNNPCAHSTRVSFLSVCRRVSHS
jgi:hypothetical protein